jgi:hypothetical protein
LLVQPLGDPAVADAHHHRHLDREAAKGGTRHTKQLAKVSAGTYNSYVRCQDAAGNKNKESAKISFSYAPKDEGPALAELSPSAAVYQNSVALSLSTAPAAESTPRARRGAVAPSPSPARTAAAVAAPVALTTAPSANAGLNIPIGLGPPGVAVSRRR